MLIVVQQLITFKFEPSSSAFQKARTDFEIQDYQK